MNAQETAGGEALSDLLWNWGDAYKISRDAEGWHALRRDGAGGQLDTPSAEELHERVRADYHACPVPRDFDPGDRG